LRDKVRKMSMRVRMTRFKIRAALCKERSETAAGLWGTIIIKKVRSPKMKRKLWRNLETRWL
jgi:hypothetical protein